MEMDLVLPAEILAQIASFLSKKDCSALSRTSKTALYKLNSYRYLLRKAELHVIIRSMNGKVSVETNSKNRGRFVEIATPLNELDSIHESEVYAELLDYYKETGGIYMIHGVTVAILLKFLFNNFSVNRFTLCNMSQDHCWNAEFFSSLTTVIRENRWNVKEMDVSVEHFPECLLELISACNPRNLSLIANGLPDGFYQAAAISNLSILRMIVQNNLMSDDDLLSLTAVDLTTLFSTNITIQGILTVVSEWVEARREIKWMKISLLSVLAEEEWLAKFAKLDNNNRFDRRIVMGRYSPAIELKRHSDGLVMKMWTEGNEVHMETKQLWLPVSLPLNACLNE